jgi:hypothetical protein
VGRRFRDAIATVRPVITGKPEMRTNVDAGQGRLREAELAEVGDPT